MCTCSWVREVGPGRPAGVSTGGFPRAASRTRRARFPGNGRSTSPAVGRGRPNGAAWPESPVPVAPPETARAPIRRCSPTAFGHFSILPADLLAPILPADLLAPFAMCTPGRWGRSLAGRPRRGDVAMNEPALVRMMQCPGDLRDDPDGARWGQRPVLGDELGKVASLDVCHLQVQPVALPAGRRDALTTCDALIAAVSGMPSQLVKTLTWDQGSEMAGHAAFSLATAVDVYFAYPHSSVGTRHQREHQRAAAEGCRGAGAVQQRHDTADRGHVPPGQPAQDAPVIAAQGQPGQWFAQGGDPVGELAGPPGPQPTSGSKERGSGRRCASVRA